MYRYDFPHVVLHIKNPSRDYVESSKCQGSNITSKEFQIAIVSNRI